MTQQMGPQQTQTTPVEISAKAQAELTPRDEVPFLKAARENLAQNTSDATSWFRLALAYRDLQDTTYNRNIFVCLKQSSKIDKQIPAFLLAECYFEGWGTRVDCKKAYQFFSVAARLTLTEPVNDYRTTFQASEVSFGPAVIKMAKCKLLGLGTQQSFWQAYKLAQIGSTLEPKSINVWKQLQTHFQYGLATDKSETLAKFCEQNIALINEGKQPQPVEKFTPMYFEADHESMYMYICTEFSLETITLEELRSKNASGITYFEELLGYSWSFPLIAAVIWERFKDKLSADDFNNVKDKKLFVELYPADIWQKHKDKLEVDKNLFLRLCTETSFSSNLLFEIYERCEDALSLKDMLKPINSPHDPWVSKTYFIFDYLISHRHNRDTAGQIILKLIDRFAADLNADYFTKQDHPLLRSFFFLTLQAFEKIVRILLAQTHGKISQSNFKMNTIITSKEVSVFLQDLKPLMNARNVFFDALRLTKVRKGKKPTSDQIKKLSTLAAKAHAAGYHNAHFDLGQWFEKHELKAQALASYAQMTAQGKKFNEANECAYDIAQGEALNAKDTKSQSEHIKTAMGFALKCEEDKKETFIRAMFDLYCLCFYPNRIGVFFISLGDFSEELTKDNWERLFKAKMETVPAAFDQAPVLRFSARIRLKINSLMSQAKTRQTHTSSRRQHRM